MSGRRSPADGYVAPPWPTTLKYRYTICLFVHGKAPHAHNGGGGEATRQGGGGHKGPATAPLDPGARQKPH